MNITIHRGIDQIGGCITKIESKNGKKILIDLGHNLPDGDGQVNDIYDDSQKLDGLLDGVDAVFYTHPHGDHIGFETKVAEKKIPQYIGEISKEMMLVLKENILYRSKEENRASAQANYDAVNSFITYKANDPVLIYDKDGKEDITVTPFYVSHSAADAYMFVIECDGKKVLHTGDFRDHGYRGCALMPMVNYYVAPKNVDILITEGTMLGRGDKRLMPEEEIEKEAETYIKEGNNVFAMCSSMDADRLVSFYRANKKVPNRKLVVDGYQWHQLKKITDLLGSKDPKYKLIGATYYKKHKEDVLKSICHEGVTILVRNNYEFQQMIEEVYPLMKPENTFFIYSQFSGYIDRRHKAFQQRTYDFVNLKKWTVKELHTSGHASKEALTEVCKTVNPRYAIIPIHRDAQTDFRSLDIPQELKDKVITEKKTYNVGDIIITIE